MVGPPLPSLTENFTSAKTKQKGLLIRCQKVTSKKERGSGREKGYELMVKAERKRGRDRTITVHKECSQESSWK